ncbi:negative elongation factor A-like [Tubulanus polymorphus]|uniref:negative elongation factor A-like n=1 Tax=Tubulanus polymorphus TaxID=672921 RepID=UPI003DA21D06
MAGRENDVALWLHNKLGSTDDLWSGKSICSQLSQERLLHIHECFPNLQPHVKVKLLLSFMHLPRRNIEEWKADVEEIIDLAINDGDQWVSTVADILKSYASCGNINNEINENNTAFHEVLVDLKKVVKKVPEMSTNTLPLECQYINRSAHNALIGQQPIPPKHFALKRKPKSAALRAEILQKSLEAANNTSKKSSNSVPIKSRSFAKRMDNTTPMRGLSARSAMFRSPSTPTSRPGLHPAGPFGQRTPHSNIKKEGGIKLLDITEQPVGVKEAKRRRRLAEVEAMEIAKKDKVEQGTVNTTPDYAAGLMSPAPSAVSTVSSSSTPSYVPPSSSRLPITANVSGPLPVNIATGSVSQSTQNARENLQQQLRQQLGQSQQTTTTTTPPVVVPTVPPPEVIPVPQQITAPPTPPVINTSTTTNNPQPKKGLCLTREQMVDAQEIFRTSNKVTRPEKALILGFMAGSRVNPCSQHGDIVNIRLSEDVQKIAMEDDPRAFKEMIVDTYFQMNYETGEWQRVRKYREKDS